MIRVSCQVLVLLCCVIDCVPHSPAQAEELDRDGIAFFEQRIQPLLVKRCYQCHSQKAETVESDLYVDTREGLLKGGDRGPAIEPGEPARSLLIKSVQYGMDDLKMPPDRRLDDQQIADLEKWIKMGAPDPRKPEKKRTRSPAAPGNEDAVRQWFKQRTWHREEQPSWNT